MRSIVLGYSAPLSVAMDVAGRSREEFCHRARTLGLSVTYVNDRHAIASTDSAPCTPRTVHGPWRVVHFDGLLHKRTSLLIYGVKPDVMTDAEAMEHLLNEHGPASLAWPIGDWAVVAISPLGLLLACDYFGNRQLFYHVDSDGGVAWSDQSWLLAEYAECGDAFDSVYFAGLLYFMCPPDRTPFEGIHGLPPGYSGVLDEHGFSLDPYWTPKKRRIELANPREYGQTFYELLREGVRERLRVPGRKWVEISGGVDSALVAACVASCVREDSALGPVEAVHYVTDRQESAGDTRRAREAAAQCGLALRTYSHEQLLQRSMTAQIEDPREPIGAFRESPRLAFDEGIDVLLSGRLGDLVTGNREPEPGLVPDLLTRDGLRRTLHAVHEWAIFTEKPVWNLLWRLVQDRFSTRESKLVSRFTEQTRRKSAHEGFGCAPGDTLASALDQAIDAWKPFLDWPGRAALNYVDVWWWFSIHTLRLSGTYCARWTGSACARTYPLSHRPLMEFLVASPWTVFLSPSRPRRLVHEQLGQLLPHSLVGNILKSDTATWRIAPIREMWASTLMARSSNDLNLVRSGLFTADEINQIGLAVRVGRGATMALFARLIQTELWLRSRPRRLEAIHSNDKGGESHAVRKA